MGDGADPDRHHASQRGRRLRGPPPARAVLGGWHANNGVLLGDERLGVLCATMTTDGRPGLEGDYSEHDRRPDAGHPDIVWRIDR